MLQIAESVLNSIGSTPLVRLNQFTKHVEGNIFAKLEYFSPGLSKKDRIALEMIESAEEKGLLEKGQPIIELTSGSMGTGLAIVCNLKKYPFIAVMSKGNSIERAQVMQAFGAKVVLVDQHPDSQKGKVTGKDLELVEEKTKELTRKYNAFKIDQFNNPGSVTTGETRLGPEIITQLGDTKIDAFVDFMGTEGSFIGVSNALKKAFPPIQCFGVEPVNAAFYNSIESTAGTHIIQGGGYHVPLKFIDENKEIISDFIKVSDKEAIESTRLLASEECIFAGYSGGANAAAALKLLKSELKGKIILIIIPDSGTKYLSTDLWDILEYDE
ncbi:PLP-dependent cysteine synthase family protein [Alkalicoccobacillus porphyridii]|uniref:Cysteine synthase family protein n=1 Tax=Alkalicoccobacillus porphyridii TaxID=2597270 RepID=A0A553ZWS1_9BACI|nr:cysteine synthase family protein [Alkalicoccobacillus porphyridii]TSB45909.1 cysteine synthase family protein [Alkalicoccobacillus porphyridii]